MKLIILSFIGIAINIWRDTSGTGGGGGFPANAIRDAQNNVIFDAQNNFIQDAT